MKLYDDTFFDVERYMAQTELFANSDSSLILGRAILSTIQPRITNLKISDYDLKGVSNEQRDDLKKIFHAINKHKVTVLDIFGKNYINFLIAQHTQH